MTSFEPVAGKHSLTSLGEAMKRMPGAMWVAQADAWDRAMRGFWKVFRSGMRLQRTGHRFTLTSPRNWPIEITTVALPSYTNPDFSRFRARFGTHSEAAQSLEFGGEITASRARWIAIPIAGARSRATGRVLPGHQTPDKARTKRGKRFLAQKTRNPNVVLLYPLVKPKGKRGRPRKGKIRSGRLRPGPVPAFMLVRKISQDGDRLSLHSSWVKNMPETERRLGENIGRAVAAVLAGKLPTVKAQRRFTA